MNRSIITQAMFDESVALALSAQHPDEEKRKLLASLGLPTTILSAIALGVALKAAGGDVSAAKFLRDAGCSEREADEDTNLAPYTDEELRALLKTFEEERYDTRAKNGWERTP